MLVFLGGFFTIQGVEPPEKGSAINVTSDPDYSSYNIAGEVFAIDDVLVGILGASVILGGLSAWALKSPIPIGAALFSGFLALLYVRSATIINDITPEGQVGWIIPAIIGLIGICIGILAAFTIIEYLAQQTGAD